jgi:hypothetical protein
LLVDVVLVFALVDELTCATPPPLEPPPAREQHRGDCGYRRTGQRAGAERS